MLLIPLLSSSTTTQKHENSPFIRSTSRLLTDPLITSLLCGANNDTDTILSALKYLPKLVKQQQLMLFWSFV
jgi:hypothetical protein